jgi:hypothetical protein
MKLNLATSDREENGTAVEAPEPKGFRRLKFNELVSEGDFVQDETRGMQPWDGPRGFQAGSFVKPIFRTERRRTSVAKKRK